MKTILTAIFAIIFWMAPSLALDVTSEIVNKAKPNKMVLPNLSTQDHCTQALHQVRREELKIFGGASVASVVSYVVTKKAIARKLEALHESIRILNSNKQSGKAAAQRYGERAKLLETYLHDLVGLKEMTKRIHSYYGVFDPAFEKAFEAQIKVLEENAHFWENKHKRNFSPEQHSQKVRKASEAIGNMKSMLESQQRKSLDIVAHAFTTLPKLNAISSFTSKLPSAFAFLCSAPFLGFQLFTYSPKPASGTLSEQAVQDEYLFNDQVPAKDLCQQIISGDPKDFEVARRKIGAIMSIKLAERTDVPSENESKSSNAR